MRVSWAHEGRLYSIFRRLCTFGHKCRVCIHRILPVGPIHRDLNFCKLSLKNFRVKNQKFTVWPQNLQSSNRFFITQI